MRVCGCFCKMFTVSLLSVHAESMLLSGVNQPKRRWSFNSGSIRIHDHCQQLTCFLVPKAVISDNLLSCLRNTHDTHTHTTPWLTQSSTFVHSLGWLVQTSRYSVVSIVPSCCKIDLLNGAYLTPRWSIRPLISLYLRHFTRLSSSSSSSGNIGPR